MARASRVRPWKALSNTTTPGRPVAARAILTTFSVASAPEFTSMVRLSWSPGVIRLRASATATYGSFITACWQV